MKSLRLLLFASLVPAAWGQTITTTSPLPGGSVGQFYDVFLTCTNCASTPLWGASGLPSGITMNAKTGEISGTPTVSGTFNVTATVQNPGGPVVSKSLSLTITAALSIVTTSLSTGTIGIAYSQQLTASGGQAPYSWQLSQTSQALPPGLAISSGGLISGTPTAVGTYSFTVQVFDQFEANVQAQLSITVSNAPAATITTQSLPNGTVNQPYNAQLNCVNCTGYTWSVAGSQLPQGLTLAAASGAITGTPSVAGTFSFVIGLNPPASTRANPVTMNYTVTINAGGLAITQASLPVAFVGTAYSTTLTGTGGTPPYNWSFETNTNDGLTIGASTGTISGTPAAIGQFAINVLLTDAIGLTATRSYVLSVSASLSILTTSLPNGTVGNVYPTQTLSAGGGQPPYRWTISGTGTLPPGLTLDGVFGRISGTPTTAGAYPFTLVVTDNQAATANVSLSITVSGGISISPATLPNGIAGVAYNQTLTATGGTAPYSWSVPAGALPAGVTLNTSTGVLSGTPTTAGAATFTVQATDSTQAFGQIRYSVTIANGPLAVTTTSLPDGTIGAAYSQTLGAAGGTAPYTWTITGSLPAGLTLNATTGAIAGTPTAAGTSSFTAVVTDAAKAAAQQALSITTATGLSVTPTSLPNAVVGTAYTQKFTATGGKAPYTFAITGTLPNGFSFAAATATISGTAPAAETGNFTLVVTDASSRTLNVPLTLTATAGAITLTPTTLSAVVGVAFTQVLTASGGTPPYTYSLGSGNLPSGFTFNVSNHTISGTATGAGTTNFSIVVTDSSGTAGTPFNILFNATNPPAPTLTVTGIPPTSGFSQQLPVAIAIGSPYPVAINGTILLTFAPSVTPATGVDDAMIQFSSGSRSISFTIPAGSTTPTLSNASSITILTGTTAGTITVATNLKTSGSNPVDLGTTTKTIVNNGGVPFISSVTFQQTPGGVTVTVVGFSSTREMVSGLFHFAPASNVTFTQSDITVPLAAPFTTWWSNTAQSNPFGTQFTLTAPFTLSTQSTSVVSVTVTLTNTKGNSNPVSLSQ